MRDVVRAYRLLVEKGEVGQVYNVCSGRAVSIQEVADELATHTTSPVRFEVDPARLRPVDVPEVCGDNTKLRTATDWTPVYALEQTLADVYDWWARSI